jgi:hypothetical protein
MNKDLNFGLLMQEMAAAGVPIQGVLIAGFNHVGSGHYVPFVSTQVIATATGQPDVTAEPGELQFRNDPALTGPQETALDGVLTAHDETQQSDIEVNRSADIVAKDLLIDRYQNWGTLSNAQKDTVLENLCRVVARLIDRSTNI